MKNMNDIKEALVSFDSLGPVLASICPGHVTRYGDLRNLSRWKIGGFCQWLVEPQSVEQMAKLLGFFHNEGVPHIVIGDGSNLLFDSEGLDSVVVKVGKGLSDFRVDGNSVFSQAGIWVPRLARIIAQSGLIGIQHTIGIPGTLGGLVCMNGGSQRKGIGDNVIRVVAVSPEGEVKTFRHIDCMFDYRESVFQTNRHIIVEVEMEFPEGEYQLSRKEMLKIMRSRRERFPLKLPNCGSVFVSNPKMYEVIGPPGKAIEDCGLKGFRVGGAQFSPSHANFIVNNGDAKSSDVLDLINKARTIVYQRTGYKMDTEVLYVSRQGQLIKPHTLCEV